VFKVTMLVFLLAAAAHSTDGGGDAERVSKIVDGRDCFPPLGVVKSTILVLLAGSLVAFAGMLSNVMFKFYKNSTQPQEFASSSSGGRDPASFIGHRDREQGTTQ
jgi:hypothetical protein